jgi:hypothetical protein
LALRRISRAATLERFREPLPPQSCRATCRSKAPTARTAAASSARKA